MIEKEIAGIRGTMGGVLRELDHRRHELFDWRLQLRRHGAALAIGAAALTLVIVGWAVTRRRVQARRPRRQNAEPSAARKILTAALASAASVGGKTLAKRFIASTTGSRV